MIAYVLRYVDLDKAYTSLTRAFLKTLFNLFSRHENEAKEPLLKGVLEKRSRVDVTEDISLLAPSERELLEAWEAKSEKYNIAASRVEQSLFLLRDCSVDFESKGS